VAAAPLLDQAPRIRYRAEIEGLATALPEIGGNPRAGEFGGPRRVFAYDRRRKP
jgi:hypothetical protein